MKNRVAFTFAVLACTGALIAQTPQPAAPAAPATTQQTDPVVMSFGTTQVRASELDAAIKTLPEEYQQFVNGPGKRQFADDYLRMKILASEGQKAGIDKDPKVQAQIQLMRENTIANAQVQRMMEQIKVADADVQKAYDAKKGEYERAQARHILIAFKGSPAASAETTLTEEQARAKAEDIRKKIAGGADFAELAKTESDDKSSGARGGDLGEFSKGQMVPEFEKAAFEGKVGEVGPVVRTQFGYHVIQVQSRNSTPMAEVRPQLENEIKQQRLQSVIQSLRDAAKPVMNDAYFGPAAPAAQPPAGN